MPARAEAPTEIAEGVHWLSFGLVAGNAFFVRSGASWALIDTATAGRAPRIRAAAEALFGKGARPTAIFLTHLHPDHSGSALELARGWECPVYVHPREMALAVERSLATVERYANPLDRWLVLPVLRRLPRRWVESMLAKQSLEGVVHALEPDRPVPELPGWHAITTAGHTPGHVVFFREHDRVLIAGDAVLTVDLRSLAGWLAVAWSRTPRPAAPPRFTNWNDEDVRASLVTLARLEPRVLACGHGVPMKGEGMAQTLHDAAARG